MSSGSVLIATTHNATRLLKNADEKVGRAEGR